MEKEEKKKTNEYDAFIEEYIAQIDLLAEVDELLSKVEEGA